MKRLHGLNLVKLELQTSVASCRGAKFAKTSWVNRLLMLLELERIGSEFNSMMTSSHM